MLLNLRYLIFILLSLFADITFSLTQKSPVCPKNAYILYQKKFYHLIVDFVDINTLKISNVVEMSELDLLPDQTLFIRFINIIDLQSIASELQKEFISCSKFDLSNFIDTYKSNMVLLYQYPEDVAQAIFTKNYYDNDYYYYYNSTGSMDYIVELSIDKYFSIYKRYVEFFEKTFAHYVFFYLSDYKVIWLFNLGFYIFIILIFLSFFWGGGERLDFVAILIAIVTFFFANVIFDVFRTDKTYVEILFNFIGEVYRDIFIYLTFPEGSNVEIDHLKGLYKLYNLEYFMFNGFYIFVDLLLAICLVMIFIGWYKYPQAELNIYLFLAIVIIEILSLFGAQAVTTMASILFVQLYYIIIYVFYYLHLIGLYLAVTMFFVYFTFYFYEGFQDRVQRVFLMIIYLVIFVPIFTMAFYNIVMFLKEVFFDGSIQIRYFDVFSLVLLFYICSIFLGEIKQAISMVILGQEINFTTAFIDKYASQPGEVFTKEEDDNSQDISDNSKEPLKNQEAPIDKNTNSKEDNSVNRDNVSK